MESLQKYRKKAKFDIEKMQLFVESEEELSMKSKVKRRHTMQSVHTIQMNIV